MRDALAVSIPSPKASQDAVIRGEIALVIAALAGATELEAISFERFNKPDWGVRLRVLGARSWLDDVVRPEIERHLAATTFAFGEPAAEDKWVGGREDEDLLMAFDHADTAACLAFLEAEAAGRLEASRAQWSLHVVEAILGLFPLRADERLAFYRRGWEWTAESGRWDDEVFAILDGKYEAQESMLREAVSGKAAWGGREPEEIALALIEALRGPIGAIRAAVASGKTSKSVIDLAVVIGHGHSNRLGIHATQEATMRYLVWRALGGRRPPSA
ncbi:MAG TPA: hypothetical protein VFV19_16550 [Candidatus Polarisedimenticolaceae bacterium]|nr:hypothetical protein [Candidatus Polarisedimenticolaceae bacterium]